MVSIPGSFQPPLDYRQDLFLAFPQLGRYPSPIDNVPESYEYLSAFYAQSKHAQRGLLLSSGVKTPEAYASTHFIVRPLRHFGGHDYRITQDGNDYDPNTQYISPAFEKWREYRVFFIRGNPLVILRKKPAEGLGVFDAWNHTSGSFFQTVLHRDESPLLRSSFIEDAKSVCVLRDTHLIAADVLLRRDFSYAVTEVNFAPAISISSNIEVISNALASPLAD